MQEHRDAELTSEIYIVVLRLVQLRDCYAKSSSGLQITSVKYKGVELGSSDKVDNADLSAISYEKAKSLGLRIGFKGSVRGQKCDITIDGKDYAIRCLNYTDRALINHSHRRKYEAVCKRLNLDISELDEMIQEYWTRRSLGAFNEDCYFYSDLNPFLSHRDYLKELLTYMAFNSFDYNKDPLSNEFVKDSVDRILDYVTPWDESSWNIYFPNNYFDSIWSSLCFSMRDRKGMPKDEDLLLPENEDIMKWVYLMGGRYKGALHIRVKKYDAASKPKVFEEEYKEQIIEVKQNQGERDEYLLKLFLIECRERKASIPIGNSMQVVKSVGSKNSEYGRPNVWLKWKQLSAEDLIYVCNSVHANKAGRDAKADVFVNGIGISVKSENGAPPAIINHTTRDKILRVMDVIHQPIMPLDQIVDNYWYLRQSGRCKEDVANSNPDSPFVRRTNELVPRKVLTPLLNYFAFDGTGTRNSAEPATLILSLQTPDDVNTWRYYDKSNFIDSIWSNLIFSIRSKGMPENLFNSPYCMEIMRWTQLVDDQYKGSLHVRIAKKKA